MPGLGIVVVALIVIGIVGILPVVGFIILISMSSKLSNLESEMLKRFAKLDEALKKLQFKETPEASESKASSPEPAPVFFVPYQKESAKEDFSSSKMAESKPEPAEAPKTEEAAEAFTAPPIAPAAFSASPHETEATLEEKPEDESAKAAPEFDYEAPKPSQPEASDFERNAVEAIKKIWNWLLVGEEREGVSLEYAIATTWLVRGAMIIILTAIAFGINYSIKNGLIGPEGRVAMGFGAGIFMTGWGLWLAKGKYRPAAQGLMGGGFAALYFSAFASAMIYHLIPQTAAFGLMALITACACVVAIRSNAMLIAILGTIGGYLTPIVLSTGVKNFEGLFGYMAMLGCGILFVARKRDWTLLNALSLIFTWAIYYLALDKFYDKATDYPVAICAGAAFFLIFSLIPLIYNLTHKRNSTALELVLMFVNSIAFFAGAHALTIGIYPKANASIISLGLAAYNIAFAWLLGLRKDKDCNLFFMLYAFASFFVAFSVPLLLGSEWITAAWSLQALVLLWLALRLKGRFLEALAYILYVVAAGRLLCFDMPSNFFTHGQFFNLSSATALLGDSAHYWSHMPARIGTFATFIISLAGAWQLLKKAEPSAVSEERSFFLKAFILASLGALLLYLHFEFNFLTQSLMPPLKQPLLSAIWTAGLLISLWQWTRTKSLISGGLTLFFGAGLFIKLFFFDLPAFGAKELIFQGPLGLEHLGMRLLDFAPALLALFFGLLAARKVGEQSAMKAFCAGFIIALFAYLTLEVKTMAHFYAPGIEAGSVSILWGLFALGLLLPGIRRGIAPLRASGLILFLVTAIKIFTIDLASLSQLARIGAFLGLGIAILAGAFVYMKFRSVFEKPTEKSGDGAE